jgi:transcription antitermination factor NusG
MGVPAGKPTEKIRDFIDAVESTFAAKEVEIDRAVDIMRNREASKEARREALRVMQAYTPGDLLEVICGPFAGTIVAFGAMVERAASKLPEIEVSLSGLEWGTMRMDPLHVRKVG